MELAREIEKLWQIMTCGLHRGVEAYQPLSATHLTGRGADRLVKVSSNGVSQWRGWYDASSRRIAKTERAGGAIVRTLYLTDGWSIVAALNESGQLRETFTRGMGLAGDIGTLVAVTHHTGSSTNGTFYTHHNHRGDITLTRSGTSTVGGYSYSAFGLETSAFGADVCRFKFSSKERDVSTGFSYYGYRFYAPQWQRWVNRDPIQEKGGNNLYGFVRNNPVAVRLLGWLTFNPPIFDPNGPNLRPGGIPGYELPRQ
jgi:RHS repeat-associated protein